VNRATTLASTTKPANLEADTDQEDERGIITDSGDDTDQLIDSDDEDEFDPDLDRDDVYEMRIWSNKGYGSSDWLDWCI
jgi:hypothetical protein